MSGRTKLRRLERALNASAAQAIMVFGHLPDLPLPDDDAANPAYQPSPEGPCKGASPLAQPAAQGFGAIIQLKTPAKGAA
jgi:hypothetical protein